MEQGTDEVLMGRVAGGDFDAFEALVHRHSPRLYGFAFRLIGRRDDAEDVVQETFLRLWRHAKSYNPRRPFKTWLYTIARRIALNAARSARARGDYETETRRPGQERQPALEDVADERPTPEERLSSLERGEEVRRALAGLPPRQRMALVLHHYEEMSYRQVAEVMGVSVSSVESLIFRARRSLLQALGEVLGESI